MSHATTEVVVLGADGFVGEAISRALESRHVEVVKVKAPRIPPVSISTARTALEVYEDVIDQLALTFDKRQVVINAAGIADAASDDENVLVAANGVLPGILADAANRATVRRFVHISSASVQGRLSPLDASNRYAPFSAYSRSKVLGEQHVLDRCQTDYVIYRPAGVHGVGRSTSRTLARIARSPFATVAGDGSQPSPQALVDNIGDAAAFLAVAEQVPPRIVAHPAEGLTCRDLMRLLGGREPKHIPRSIAAGAVAAMNLLGSSFSPIAAHSRRVEMLWFGQSQAPSWLTAAGWSRPIGRDGWSALAEQLRQKCPAD